MHLASTKLQCSAAGYSAAFDHHTMGVAAHPLDGVWPDDAEAPEVLEKLRVPDPSRCLWKEGGNVVTKQLTETERPALMINQRSHSQVHDDVQNAQPMMPIGAKGTVSRPDWGLGENPIKP